MTLNTFECNYLTPLYFKWLNRHLQQNVRAMFLKSAL